MNRLNNKIIVKCIELTDNKYQHYYNEAKKIGQFDLVKEKEYVCAATALKELKADLLALLLSNSDISYNSFKP